MPLPKLNTWVVRRWYFSLYIKEPWMQWHVRSARKAHRLLEVVTRKKLHSHRRFIALTFVNIYI